MICLPANTHQFPASKDQTAQECLNECRAIVYVQKQNRISNKSIEMCLYVCTCVCVCTCFSFNHNTCNSFHTLLKFHVPRTRKVLPRTFFTYLLSINLSQLLVHMSCHVIVWSMSTTGELFMEEKTLPPLVFPKWKRLLHQTCRQNTDTPCLPLRCSSHRYGSPAERFKLPPGYNVPPIIIPHPPPHLLVSPTPKHPTTTIPNPSTCLAVCTIH